MSKNDTAWESICSDYWIARQRKLCRVKTKTLKCRYLRNNLRFSPLFVLLRLKLTNLRVAPVSLCDYLRNPSSDKIGQRTFEDTWGEFMAHQHSTGFLKIVEDAKKRIRETTIDDVKAKLDRGEKFLLIDVREESEYAADHLPGATHLGKGVIERDVEARVPDHNAPVVLYCGGGFRSALAADNLQKMGYTNVLSMDGGVRGWREKGFGLTKD